MRLKMERVGVIKYIFIMTLMVVFLWGCGSKAENNKELPEVILHDAERKTFPIMSEEELAKVGWDKDLIPYVEYNFFDENEFWAYSTMDSNIFISFGDLDLDDQREMMITIPAYRDSSTTFIYTVEDGEVIYCGWTIAGREYTENYVKFEFWPQNLFDIYVNEKGETRYFSSDSDKHGNFGNYSIYESSFENNHILCQPVFAMVYSGDNYGYWIKDTWEDWEEESQKAIRNNILAGMAQAMENNSEQQDIAETVSESEWNRNITEEETFISNSSQIKSNKVSEKIEKNESAYFGIWNECLPVFSENTEVYINIENDLRFHADEVKEEFEKELEEWILNVDNMDKEKIESHMDWIQENGLVVGDFIVEEVHYQSDQYIVFLVRCGSVENITPPRGYRYKMFSYNLETGQEMTLSNFNLEKEDWTQILEKQYMILCDQFPETYDKKYIKKILEGFNPEALEEYANDLYYFSDEGIMFYFNRSITNDEMNTDSNASSSGSDYPGIFWEKMKLYNHFLIPYENLWK